MNHKPLIAMIIVFGLLLGSLGFGPIPRTGAQETGSHPAEPFRWLAGPDSALPPSENWMPLPAGETHWYAFDYQGHLESGKGADEGKMMWFGSQIHISLDAEPDQGATFSIWTPEQVRRWGLGDTVEPVGRGTKNEFEPGDLFWSGSFASPGRYYIVVEHRGSAPCWLSLSIRSQDVAVPTVRETAQRLRDEGHGAVASGAALGVLGLDAHDAGKVLKDVGYAAVAVGQALSDAFGLDAQNAARILKDIGFSAGEVGLALKDGYGLNAQSAVSILKDVFALDALGTTRILRNVFALDALGTTRILRNVFELDARGAVQVLKSGGFLLWEVGLALRDVLGQDARGTTRVLRDTGSLADEAGLVLEDVFELDARSMALVLRDAGFETGEVSLALGSLFSLDASSVTQVLKDAGFPPGAVLQALQNGFGLDAQGAAEIMRVAGFAAEAISQLIAHETPRKLADFMRGAGFSAADVNLALGDVWELDAQSAAQALMDVGYRATDIGLVLKDSFGLDARSTAQVLKNVGLPAVGIGLILKQVSGLDAQSAAESLKSVDFSASEVGLALLVALGQNAESAVTILKDIGFVASEVDTLALWDVFLHDAPSAAQVLKDGGLSATEVGLALKSAFGLDGKQTANILQGAGFAGAEMAQALRDAFSMDAGTTARILNSLGVDADSAYKILKTVFYMSTDRARQILLNATYSADGIFETTIPDLVVKFAPQLRMDEDAETFPMSAQKYYDEIVRTRPSDMPSPDQMGRIMVARNLGVEFDPKPKVDSWLKWAYAIENNNNPQTLTESKVPTYWKAFACGGQVRIVYWWFYGWQPTCDGVSGDHNGDWERVMVILSEDATRVAAVTYWQHSGWYTRISGKSGFGLVDGTHPVVYAGLKNHGSYHNTENIAQSCCYWSDNRDDDGSWLNAWNNLVPVQPVSEGGEEWMDARGFQWGFDGISNHPMTNSDASCGMKACQGTPTWGCQTSGCWRSQCEVGDRDDGLTCRHCATGYTDCGASCAKGGWGNCFLVWKLHSITRYGHKYAISGTDTGLLHKDPGW